MESNDHLPPGDEGLAEAYDRGYRTVEPLTWHWATLAHEWAETTEKQRRATSAGVAAVLAAHRANVKHELKQAVERMKARDRQHEITYRLLSNERDAAKQRLAEANAAKGGVPIPVAYIVTDQSCETVPWVMVNGVRYVRENAKTVAATRKDRV